MNASQIRENIGRKMHQSEMVAISEMSPWEVEDLLDWMENQGCTILQLEQSIEGFIVRLKCPPGIQLIPTFPNGRAAETRIAKIAVEWSDGRTPPSSSADPCRRGRGLMPALIPA